MRGIVIATVIGVTAVSSGASAAQVDDAVHLADWLTFAANMPEAGYRHTQFYAPHYNTSVLQWEGRLESWLPPGRDHFSWGPYIRVAGIAGARKDGFQNAWLALPGVGFQIYPFSTWRFQGRHNTPGNILGPLRFFAEYNWQDYWGAANAWRPEKQWRVGFEYWKAVNVNDTRRDWWLETWNGLYWQSSNDVTEQYKTSIFANAWRVGVRVPKAGSLSAVTPYFALESSRTKYDYNGPASCPVAPNSCNFYWENRLNLGGGIRFAPALGEDGWLTRMVVYAEYLRTAAYYSPPPPASVPRYDLRVGVSFTIGQWYQ